MHGYRELIALEQSLFDDVAVALISILKTIVGKVCTHNILELEVLADSPT